MRKVSYKEFIRALNVVNDYHKQIKDELDGVEKEIFNSNIPRVNRKDEKLIDTNLSVRLFNNLCQYFRAYLVGNSLFNADLLVSDLEKISLGEIKKMRGFGKMLEKELIQICKYSDINLKP